MSDEALSLSVDALGQLLWHPGPTPGLTAEAAVPVVPVRAFPLSAPDDGISLVGPDGRERAWIDRLSSLPEPARGWIVAELAARDFAPVIRRIRGVSGFTMPSTWDVETDRGDSRLTIKGEEAFRRLPGGALMVTDSRGIGFRVPDVAALDGQSRKWLDRFL